MSAFASASKKLRDNGFPLVDLPRLPTSPIWNKLEVAPFSLSVAEISALHNHVEDNLRPPISPLIEHDFGCSPAGDLAGCLVGVPDVSLHVALLGPGACLYNELPAVVTTRSGKNVTVTKQLVEEVLNDLTKWLRSLPYDRKPSIEDEYIMAIRLYTLEEPIPFYWYLNDPLNKPNRGDYIRNLKPLMRLLIKALRAMGEAGYYKRAPAYRGVTIDKNPILLAKYHNYRTSFVVQNFITLAGFTSVSLDGGSVEDFGDSLFFQMPDVTGVDVSSISQYPKEYEMLLIPPSVFVISSVLMAHNQLTVTMSTVDQPSANYMPYSLEVPAATAPHHIEARFDEYYNLLICGCSDTWNMLLSAADSEGLPLAEAVVAIAYSSDGHMRLTYKNKNEGYIHGRRCLDWLQHNLQASNKCALFCLARFYKDGIVVPMNKDEASRLSLKSAELGCAAAQLLTGSFIETEGNVAEAVKWYLRSAERGFSSAQCKIGMIFESGAQGHADINAAIHYFKLSAAQKNPWGHWRLGICYQEGRGVPKDMREAIKQFEVAGWNGIVDAQQRKSRLQQALIDIEYLEADFDDVYNRILCDDEDMWNLVENLSKDYSCPLAEAVVVIGFGCDGHMRLKHKDKVTAECYARKCVGWLKEISSRPGTDNKWPLYCLARFYKDGIGVKQNVEEATRLCSLSAFLGCACAQSLSGQFHEAGVGGAINMVEARRLYTLAANVGFARAQTSLGFLCEMENGDLDAAFKWYTLAARQGDPIGKWRLGECYHYGKGATKDVLAAAELYRVASERGVTVEALDSSEFKKCLVAAEIVERDFDSIYNELVNGCDKTWELVVTTAFDAGSPLALALVAIGYGGAPMRLKDKNVQLASDYGMQCLSWLQGKVVESPKYAAFCLARYYLDGIAVERNRSESARLSLLSAELGCAPAQVLAGVCHEFGIGCERSIVKAVRLYTLAAESGSSSAQSNLGGLYQQGEGVEQNIDLAVRYYRLSSQQGNPWGQWQLGLCFLEGRGVERNLSEAVRLFKLSDEQGSEDAKAALCRIFSSSQGPRSPGHHSPPYPSSPGDRPGHASPK
jgi:TPR repeat protein